MENPPDQIIWRSPMFVTSPKNKRMNGKQDIHSDIRSSCGFWILDNRSWLGFGSQCKQAILKGFDLLSPKMKLVVEGSINKSFAGFVPEGPHQPESMWCYVQDGSSASRELRSQLRPQLEVQLARLPLPLEAAWSLSRPLGRQQHAKMGCSGQQTSTLPMIQNK